MLKVYTFIREVRSIVAVAFIVIATVGSFRTNGYCNAFSAIEEHFVGTRLSSLLTRAAVGVSIDAPTIRNLQPRTISVSCMTSSDENDQVVGTTGTGGHGVARSLVMAIDGEDTESSPPFDKDVWKMYENIMKEIMIQRRVIKKCDDETISKCRAFLLSFQQHLSPVPNIIKIVSDDQENKRETLTSSLRQQSEQFQQLFNYTSAEVEYINRCLVYMGDACAKLQSKRNSKQKSNSDSDNCDVIDPRLPIAVAWHKLKEMGYVIRENSMSTYMYILSNSGDSESNIEYNFFVDDTLLEVVTCHDTIYKPSEKTVTIRLKSLISRGKIDEAEDMFATSFNGGSRISSSDSATELAGKSDKNQNKQGRLRTYMPLMEHYCMSGNLTSTLRLFQQMQDCTGVHWDVESYSLLLSSVARFGFFFSNNTEKVHERDASNDFSSSENLDGPILFDMLASNMAKDILELTENTSVELIEAFQDGISAFLGEGSAFNGSHESKRFSAKGVVVERVKIPKGNGTCPVSDVKLRLLVLDELQRQHVHNTLLEMSRTTTEEFMSSIKARQQKAKKGNRNKKQKIRDTAQAAQPDMESYGYQELLKFSKWLE